MFRAGGEWSFPDKRRFVKRGFERPLNGNKKRKAPPATPPLRLNARHNAFNALFIPPAEESEAIRAHQRNKFELSSTPDRAEAYKIYLPTRAALFSNQPYSTPDNCIMSHCALPHPPFRPLSAPLDPSSPHALIVCIFYR